MIPDKNSASRDQSNSCRNHPSKFANRMKGDDSHYRKKIGAPVDNPFFRHSFPSSLTKNKRDGLCPMGNNLGEKR
jgi:hypothetical protein